MKKIIILATMLLLLLGFSGQGMAKIRININIPLPPAFVFSAPPQLVVIPGTYVYYYPDVDFDIFFYAGYWYRPNSGYWYRSTSYDGPWVYIERAPSVLLSLPPNYRIITRGERRIPYGELHRNWRVWGRERYWEHHNWGRPEHERRYGLAPSFRERGYGGFYGGGRYEDRGRH
jgi:hypothetical protein